MSRAVVPYIAQLVGVDISLRMVEVYNMRANMQDLELHKMHTVGSLAKLHQQRFDLAVVRASFSFLRLRFFLALIMVSRV